MVILNYKAFFSSTIGENNNRNKLKRKNTMEIYVEAIIENTPPFGTLFKKYIKTFQRYINTFKLSKYSYH